MTSLETLGFWKRRKLKSKVRKLQKAHIDLIEYAKKLMLNKESEIIVYKNLMIDAILGNSQEKITGLNLLFEITDEETGESANKEYFEGLDTEELTTLFEDLIKGLEKEI